MEKLKIVLKYVFFAIIAVGLLVSFTSRCGYGTDDIDEARKEAYEEGYEAGQEDILEDPSSYGIGSYVEYADSSDEDAAYERGVEDGYAEGYQDCLDEHGIIDEEWEALHEN